MAKVGTATSDHHVGTYRMSSGTRVRVRRKDDILVVETDRPGSVESQSSSNTHFFVIVSSSADVTFRG